MFYCEVCGNEIKKGVATCKFCGAEQRAYLPKKKFSHEIVNIEIGRPTVDLALTRLDSTLKSAALNNTNVLTLIHGYGSSGKGGVIGQEVRKMLDFMVSRGEVAAYIIGEDFGKRHGPSREQVRRYPQLAKDRNYNHANRGISLVFF
ncbi:MAG: Smr/MutS family protein [Desulfotalea sp.]